MKTKAIKQTVTFNSSPEKIYDILMNSKKHSEITESDVKMSTKVKGTFNVFDGYCHGYNIELEKGKKIVQAWHFAEEGWPEDHYSICTFTFEKTGNKTKLIFQQTAVPEHKVNPLKSVCKVFACQPINAPLTK